MRNSSDFQWGALPGPPLRVRYRPSVASDATAGNPRRPWRRWIAASALALFGAFGFAELSLQVASLFAPERLEDGGDGARYRVLCVGDSHTWGAGVERDESYPGHLQRILDELRPGLFQVMNLGVPGMNTAQLRKRVPEWFSRHEPDLLVVWAGVNNAWNTAEVEDAPTSFLAWLDRQLLRSRVYRLGRVRFHDRKLERYALQRPEDGTWNGPDRSAYRQARWCRRCLRTPEKRLRSESCATTERLGSACDYAICADRVGARDPPHVPAGIEYLYSSQSGDVRGVSPLRGRIGP